MVAPKVLDVTLRDGGCVNDFNFGSSYMRGILTALEESGVDIIELGYLDNKNGSKAGRTKYCTEAVVKTALLTTKIPGKTYLAMMDYGKFDVEKLASYSSDGIDGIRLAFHKKNRKDMIRVGKTILSKGYKLFVQPMLTLHYSDCELYDLINDVLEELPNASAIYIVDSFGEMREDNLTRIAKIYNERVPESIAIGLHSHNNLQLSYSLAIHLMTFLGNRQLIIDSSVLGMGKGAGNLCTELLVEYLNNKHDTHYKVGPLLEVIDHVINVLKQETPWGYSAEYYLSSIYHCTPSYASYFYNKQMLSMDQVGELLGTISEEKKISFDKAYAEELYYKFRAEKSFDDSESIHKLETAISGKIVLLIAPGRSIIDSKNVIEQLCARNDVVAIGLNNTVFDTDYTLITRLDLLNDKCTANRTIITTSRISNHSTGNRYALDYHKWIVRRDKVYDSSAVIALNLAEKCGAKEIYLAGFDGFSPDVNSNYFNKDLRRPVVGKSASERNLFYTDFITGISATIPVKFLTDSLYDVRRHSIR